MMDAPSRALWTVFISTLISYRIGGGHGAATNTYHRFCYLDTMARVRQGAGRFTLSDLNDVTLCTHLVFVHALVDPVNLELDPALQNDFEYHYKEVTDLKGTHPDLKVLLLVGGPDPNGRDAGVSDRSIAFSWVVNSTDQVDIFVGKVASYLRYFNFDGVEIDWRYPGLYGSVDNDVYGFSVLVRKLRETFEQEANSENNQPRLMLTVRVSGDRYILQNSIQLDQVISYADYLMVTTYDFYMSEEVIGHNSGLYGRNGDSSAHAPLNTDYIIQYLTQYRDVPANQIVLGIPSFGRTVVFINDTLQAFGVPHNGSGPPGPYTGQPGLLAFYEICSLLQNGWTEIEDDEQLAPFAFSEKEIVTYDNPDSVSIKANYIKDHRLAGAALWDLSNDDFSGVFCDMGRFPLASALRLTLTSPRTWCPAGERGALDLEGCEQCPVGSYQPLENTMDCLQCPQGLTTLAPGSTHHYQCILPCNSGTEYKYVTSSCDPCPLGFYRLQGRDPACLKCPRGYTTVATSSSECVRRPAGVPEIIPRQIDVRATLTFAATSCENKPVIVGAVRMLVADYFIRLAQVWTGLCDVQSCDNVMSDVIQGCEGPASGDVRRKRDAEERLSVLIIVGNVSEEVNNTDSTRHTHSVVAAALNEQNVYEPLTTYGIQFIKLETMETQVVCEPGFAATNGKCEICPAGTYHNTSSSTCSPCPVGQYQHLEGQAACWPCEGLKTTLDPGSTDPDRCVSPCEARPLYCYNDGVCHWTEVEPESVYCECRHAYQGDRCQQQAETQSASAVGTVVGAVVGGVLAFLIIILIIVACCVCVRMRKAVQLRHINNQRQDDFVRGTSINNTNHYMTWGSFRKGSTGQRGVKFVDYIDYYTWLNNLSDHQQQTAKCTPYHYNRTKSSQHPSPKSSPTTSTTATEPLPSALQHTSTPNGNTHTSGAINATISPMTTVDHE